jgi:hypothetical protein
MPTIPLAGFQSDGVCALGIPSRPQRRQRGDTLRTNEAKDVLEGIADLADPPAVLDSQGASIERRAGASKRLKRRIKRVHAAIGNYAANSSGRLRIGQMESQTDGSRHDCRKACPINLAAKHPLVPRNGLVDIVDEEDDTLDGPQHVIRVGPEGLAKAAWKCPPSRPGALSP